MSSLVAIVPLRTPGKSRLAPALDPARRAALTAAMFLDVVAALRAAELDPIVVAAADPEAVAMATSAGLRWVRDDPAAPGLAGGVDRATTAVGADRDVLVVAADLPCLRDQDVLEVRSTDAEVVVAPTRDGGTGGLLRRAGATMPAAYGASSAARHLALARTGGLSHARVTTDGFHHDVDTWDDLLALDGRSVGARTADLLPDLLVRR